MTKMINDDRVNATAYDNTLYTIKMLSYNPLDDNYFVQEAKTYDRYAYLCQMCDLETEDARFSDTTIYEGNSCHYSTRDEVVTIYASVHNNYEDVLTQPTWESYETYFEDSNTGERIA